MTAAISSFLEVKPHTTPMPFYNPDSRSPSGVNEWSNIQAITYDGAAIGSQKTKVFAYVGFPVGASADKKVPAIVLVHGGGGHAYAEWIKLWTDRGYAAIAMDTTGYFPSAQGKGIAGRGSDVPDLWHYGLYGDFAEAGYGDAPNNDEMHAYSQTLEQQWMYHAVTDTILAHTILAGDSRVDSSKIGIAGISWGGVIASLAIGWDTRYAFAIPIYGSGYLDLALSWAGPLFSQSETKGMWSAADRFDRVLMPVLWLGWSNDFCFSINSNSRSYEATKQAGAILSMKLQWEHSHLHGWQPLESYRFADSIVKGGPSLTTCVTEPAGRSFSFHIKTAGDVIGVTARACYIRERLSYSAKPPDAWPATIDQTWETAPCAVEGDTVRGTLPCEAVGYYVELTTKTPGGEYITSTRFMEEL